MKALILSCNTGGGHNSSAEALREAFSAKGIDAVSVDALEFISKRTSSVMSNGHTWIYRHCPKLFSKGYSYTDKNRKIFAEDSAAYRFFTKSTPELYTFIVRGGFDVVVCAHVFPALMLTDVLKKHSLDIVSAFFATDYTCSPSAEQSDLDLYFIPDEALISEFTEYGIEPSKLYVSGIPVRKDFLKHTEKAEAKKLLSISEDHTHLVMMSGSMGCGPMKKLTRILAESLSQKQALSVVCGTNRSLFAELSAIYKDDPRIHIMGYVKNVSLLLDSADLYLTKPGGISVTEAAAKGVPMVLLDAVAGCEEYNLRFFLERGCAKTAKSTEDLSALCIQLMNDPKARQAMMLAYQSIERKDGASMMAEELIRFQNKK